MAYKIPNKKETIKEGSFAIKKDKEIPQVTISDMGDVRVFKINDKMQIYAHAEKTRNGFKHTATLMVDGQEVDDTTAHYLNRTWESYEYETAISKLIDKSLHISNKEELKNQFAKASHEKISGEFKTIGAIASLGEVFATTKKEKNDWKLRMLKAGLEKQGLSVPEDWDTLNEKEKERRLNAVIGHLKEKK